MRGVFVIALSSLVACGGSPGGSGASGGATAGANADGLRFTIAKQAVGHASDGMTLRSIRHAPHPAFHRVVFDIGLAEGALATSVPYATASYREHDKSIAIHISGIRHDLTGNRPLRNEAGEPFGKPVPVDRPPVSYFARELVLDDSAVTYRIQLTRRARFRLHALRDPVRIVLDVENTGGAR
jgi:hypothetical protein